MRRFLVLLLILVAGMAHRVPRADAALAEMEPGAVRPRGPGAQVHPAAHGGGVVPLVPRHGGHDLSRSRHPDGDPRQVHPGAGRPGRRSRAQLPLRELGLARDHHARQGRQRDLQAPRLYPARAVLEAARRGDRGSLGVALVHDGRDRSERGRSLRRAPHEDGDTVLKTYDRQHGGFGETQRFLHGDTLEWVLERSRFLQRNVDTDVWRDVASRTLGGARGSSIRCGAACSSIPTRSTGPARTSRSS